MARILFVSTSTTVGGAEKTLHTLATSLDAKKHQVAGVVSLKPEGEYARRLKAAGIRVESLALDRTPRPSDASRLAAIISRERPDIVHAFMYQAIQLCRLAKTKTPVPFKLISSPRVHYRTRSFFTLLVDRALKNRDDLLISECESSREFLINNQGYDPKKIKTIRNGVDLPAERQKQRVNPNDLHIAAVGRLDKQKGFATLIEAMARLKTTNLHCVILGDGPERARLESLVRQHELGDRVQLPGERSDIASRLFACDIYCLPSLWEGLPNALLEAMALGLPVVASNVDGVPEAVENGKTGLLVPPSDPTALAEALEKFAADPALRASLGAAARIAIAEKFTVRRMIDAYQDAYNSVSRY